MVVRNTREKEEIYSFLSKSRDLQLYLIGDLDDFFWNDTEWFALYHNDAIRSIALLYKGMDPATFLLFDDGDLTYPSTLIKSIRAQLPSEMNVHISSGLIDSFGRESIISYHGLHYRMILTRDPENIYDPGIRRLEPGDMKRIMELYEDSYPDNWFDSRMLETGKYFGYFSDDILSGVAGIHVYSSEYRIAALGNIVTRKEFRGQKIAYKLTSALCKDLKYSVDTIGLNVRSDNIAAIKSYENAGFTIKTIYDEFFIRLRHE